VLFNSFNFLLFFPIVTIIYFLLPPKHRWIHLLVSSCIFYCFFIPAYILILVVTIVIDYVAGIYIEKTEGKTRKRWLILSIISTCLVLFIFKYFNFFNSNFIGLAKVFNLGYPVPTLNIILPIGLSFHTFQSLSYVIEVYRGNQKAEKHFGIYSLYVMFYPQLVAGPIERPQNVIHQFYEKHSFDYERVREGLIKMAWGLFKKVVIADRLSFFVNRVYNDPSHHFGFEIILATIFFAIQIYCDFSGYSDIALGSAKVMGFDLMKNFNNPYSSKSISEFWKRWHISLSTWFRDYVYISLGGNRVGKYRMYLNLFITFLISGFWHGANWTFIIWGALHGLYLILATVLKPVKRSFNHILNLDRSKSIQEKIDVIITFSLVCFAWIFFRANSLPDALLLIRNLGKIELAQLHLNICGENYLSWILGLWMAFILALTEYYQNNKGSVQSLIRRQPSPVRWGVYVVFATVIINLGVFDNKEFIYFQF
jgi:alginate O-acetyltransferase complex protein AlgI